MTVSIQEKKGKWYVVVSYKKENGQWATKWHKTGLVVKGNKKRAEAIASQIAKEYKDGLNLDNHWRVETFLQYWYDNVIKNAVEITTWESYGTIVNGHLIPYFSSRNLPLQKLKTADLQLYMNYKYENGRMDGKGGLSANCLKKHYAVLKKALDYAVKNDLILVNPVLNVEMPKVKSYTAKYYTVDQLEILLEHCQGSSIESAVFLSVHYGFRRGEVLGLRYCDVDFSGKTITICNTRTQVHSVVEKQPKSAASLRTLPLIPRVEHYLLALKERQTKEKALFGSTYHENDYICKLADGTPLNVNSLSHKFRRLLQNCGMPPIRFHDLRHSVASYLLKNGVSLKEIQLWCGHSDIAVTAMLYTHVDLEMQKNTGAKINALFEKQ